MVALIVVVVTRYDAFFGYVGAVAVDELDQSVALFDFDRILAHIGSKIIIIRIGNFYLLTLEGIIIIR